MQSEQNLQPSHELDARKDKASLKRFLHDVLAGYGIGVAFIIPGFSGGSIAAIFGIYERLIGAIAGIFTEFKKSILTLLPVFIGLALGAVSLLYPLKWALSAFPLPTAALFVGLALGGMPSITDNIKGKISPKNVLAFLIPAILALAICFAPTAADIDLMNLSLGGYLVLFFVGIVGSSALVIPGISGSMLLLILGYYNPLIGVITDHFFRGDEMLTAFLVLMSAGLGIVFGFIAISFVMKALLERYRRGTYFAITGFILGSIPAVFVSTAKDAGYTLATLPASPWHWVACVLLLAVGFAASFAVVRITKRGSVDNESADGGDEC